MADHFNALSAAEAERLALLLEELGEAQQAIGKILRHGYENHNPFGNVALTNRAALVRELGDVQYAIAALGDAGDISTDAVIARRWEKAKTVGRFMHHQDGPCASEGNSTGEKA